MKLSRKVDFPTRWNTTYDTLAGAREHKVILTEDYNESIVVDINDVVIDSGGGRGGDSDENNLIGINWIGCEEMLEGCQYRATDKDKLLSHPYLEGALSENGGTLNWKVRHLINPQLAGIYRINVLLRKGSIGSGKRHIFSTFMSPTPSLCWNCAHSAAAGDTVQIPVASYTAPAAGPMATGRQVRA
ncbi:hypothetical protein BC332_11433 [Capsicum chinense]|nr:hypothetical protein BC332_11433 [Capsicum chinense]